MVSLLHKKMAILGGLSLMMLLAVVSGIYEIYTHFSIGLRKERKISKREQLSLLIFGIVGAISAIASYGHLIYAIAK